MDGELVEGNDILMEDDISPETGNKGGCDETDEDEGEEKLNKNSDDSDGDSSDQEEKEALITQKIEALQSTIAATPYLYQSHVDLIDILRNEGDLDELRKARERMSKYFPLTEDLWMQWIKDEIKIISTPEDKEQVLSLFERSFSDYLSVDLWLEFVQFSLGETSSEDGIEIVRKNFERAVLVAGKHTTKGSLIWDAYREFEFAILTSLQPPGSIPTVELQKRIQEQSSKLQNIYKRQLNEPLIDMERTYNELKEWLGGEVPTDIETSYQNAIRMLSKFLPYEESLLTVENNLEVYKSYISVLKVMNDFERTLVLYERAIAHNCLQPELWLDFIKFLKKQNKSFEEICYIYKRAVRNCPWSSLIWDGYIKLMEEHHSDHQLILDIVENALSVGFYTSEDYKTVWLGYLDYLRRRTKLSDPDQSHTEDLVAVFNRACEHLAECFGLEGDPNCEILRYWALIEASYGHQMEKARSLWNDIMSQGHDKYAHMWLEFIQLERLYGDVKHCRKVFQRAMQHCQDFPELIMQSWLMFERQNGSFESFQNCKSRCEERMNVVQGERAKELSKTISKGKRKDQQVTNKKQKPIHNSKHSKQDTKIPAGTRKRTLSTDNDPVTKKVKLEDKLEGNEPFIKVKHDPSKDSRSIFVSNLDYTVDEEAIKEFLKSSGTVVEVRLVKDYKGRSKGYAFVEMSDHEDVAACLKRDRELLNSRPMFISKCEADGRLKSQAFKFSLNLEKQKLFIKGLPLKTTTEDLMKLFGQYGKLKDVRLVTYRNGHSKGLAYVDFFDESSAANALLKTDGMIIEDKPISVAISNPPERKSRADHDDRKLSLGQGSRDTGQRGGKARTKVDFVPRSLNKAGEDSAKSNISNGSTSRPLSNEDFKKMLLS